MKLTPIQEALKKKLDGFRKTIDETQEAYAQALEGHKCVAKKVGSWGGAECAICGEDLGWWCPKSKDHRCRYGNGSEG